MREEWDIEKCKLRHELVEQKFENIRSSLDNINSNLIIHNNDNQIDRNEIKDQIKVMEKSINSKLDEFDKSFRGNSKIGVFEQLRKIKFHIALLAIGIVILAGGKFMRIGEKEIKEIFVKEETKQMVKNENIATPNLKNEKLEEAIVKKIKEKIKEKKVGKIDENIENSDIIEN